MAIEVQEMEWNMPRRSHWFGRMFVIAFCISCLSAYGRDATSTTEEIPADRLLQPAELAGILEANQEKPLIFQVGSHVLFAEAHIQGAEYAGPAGQDAGLLALRDQVKDLGRDKFIVIYCGCCPWIKCPNIRQAYKELTSLGFTHVKALYLADNFGKDWVARGYPVTKGR
jgi:thiosulfate/3-mercaptopyruvate sulfurtransferase